MQNAILHGFKHRAKNKLKKMLAVKQLVVLMKILCSSFFVRSNCHSDAQSLNVNHIADYCIIFTFYLSFYR